MAHMLSSILIIFKIGGEKIGKEEQLHHHKKYEKLDENYHP